MDYNMLKKKKKKNVRLFKIPDVMCYKWNGFSIAKQWLIEYVAIMFKIVQCQHLERYREDLVFSYRIKYTYNEFELT